MDDQVWLAGDRWQFGPVRVAKGFLSRLRGIRPGEAALLLHARSVHGFWPRRRLLVAGLDGSGEVVGLASLRSGRLVTFAKAVYMLEMDAQEPPPAVGTRLSIVSECPAS